MKLISRSIMAVILLISAPLFSEEDPRAMLQGAADKIIVYLEKNKDQLEAKPELSVELVKRELLPYIDQEGLGRRVLGKAWKDASADQQKAFVSEFVDLVIDTYAKGLAQYSGQTFEFQDAEYNSKQTAARVQSVMKQTDGEPIKIDYLLRKPKGLEEWRVVDVSIEGISMANSYKNQFATQIQNEGIQSVIDKLVANEIELSK
ncbi:MAG: ABC transporter substrate-binding protein [Gammaproteobacteria bacterium]|nr:ABC transporter substrate-binding protein [Gammaproteobacteria bacterium]